MDQCIIIISLNISKGIKYTIVLDHYIYCSIEFMCTLSTNS